MAAGSDGVLTFEGREEGQEIRGVASWASWAGSLGWLGLLGLPGLPGLLGLQLLSCGIVGWGIRCGGRRH